MEGPLVKSPKPVGRPKGPPKEAAPVNPNMFVGSNIHLDHAGRPLCSHSAKICNQRRMDGFGFCVKHILEDKSAPFKQCEYMIGGNRPCQNSVPLAQEDTRYCNLHKQALGIIPKTEKKGKITASTQIDSKMDTQAPSLSTASDNTSVAASIISPPTSKQDRLPKKQALPIMENSDDEAWTYMDYSSDPDEPDFPFELYRPESDPFQFLPQRKKSIDIMMPDEAPNPPHFGEPGFELESFVMNRQAKLLNLVKFYKMRMEIIDNLNSRFSEKLFFFREKQAVILESERNLKQIDLNRTKSKALKYYQKKHKEAQILARKKAAEQKKTEASVTSPSLKPKSILDAFVKQKTSADPNLTSPTKKSAKSAKEEDLNGSKSEKSEIHPSGHKSLEPITNCCFPGCSVVALPLSKWCYCHILNDPNQCFFAQCEFSSNGNRCAYPIVKYQDPPYCANHADLLEAIRSPPKPKKKQQQMDVDGQEE